MNFKHFDAEGTPACSLALSHLWADIYGLDQRGSGKCSANDWVKLISEALQAAREKSARSILFRIIENNDAGELIPLLPALGFTFKGGRFEYRAFLSDLPDDTGSPIEWRTATELNWSTLEIGSFLGKVAEDTPDFEPGEDPLIHIQDWIKDPVLTSGRDCVSVGFIHGKPAALVVAQINPRTLWSRISYMGVIPKLRGNGYGKWIHRKGFALLKKQGGDLYHGGTNSRNEAMLRLFETHECRPYHRMQAGEKQMGSWTVSGGEIHSSAFRENAEEAEGVGRQR